MHEPDVVLRELDVLLNQDREPSNVGWKELKEALKKDKDMNSEFIFVLPFSWTDITECQAKITYSKVVWMFKYEIFPGEFKVLRHVLFGSFCYLCMKGGWMIFVNLNPSAARN